MTDTEHPTVVVPGDDPQQIAGSPHLEKLRERAEVVLYEDHPGSDEDKLRRAEPADILINSRGHVKWPGELLRKLPRLKMITTCSIGTDMIDLDAARARGITVSNVPGKTAAVVAEHALALLLSVARRTAFMTAELKAGRWTRKPGVTLAGKTLGVIGTGNIGCAMIRLARGIGMNVLAWSFHPSPAKAEQFGFRYAEFDDLLRQSDAVSLHVKLTEDSRHLIGRRELALMQPGALLVNTARGAVVETDALIEALNNGRLGGAGVDVYETEPLPVDHPLLQCEQVVLTPHSADQTPEGVDLLNAGAVENVLAWLDGRPQNVVT